MAKNILGKRAIAYDIECLYIGKKIRQTNVRILHVSRHIANCAGNYAVKLKLFPLYKVKQDSVTVRKMRETYK